MSNSKSNYSYDGVKGFTDEDYQAFVELIDDIDSADNWLLGGFADGIDDFFINWGINVDLSNPSRDVTNREAMLDSHEITTDDVTTLFNKVKELDDACAKSIQGRFGEERLLEQQVFQQRITRIASGIAANATNMISGKFVFGKEFDLDGSMTHSQAFIDAWMNMGDCKEFNTDELKETIEKFKEEYKKTNGPLGDDIDDDILIMHQKMEAMGWTEEEIDETLEWIINGPEPYRSVYINDVVNGDATILDHGQELYEGLLYSKYMEAILRGDENAVETLKDLQPNLHIDWEQRAKEWEQRIQETYNKVHGSSSSTGGSNFVSD